MATRRALLEMGLHSRSLIRVQFVVEIPADQGFIWMLVGRTVHREAIVIASRRRSSCPLRRETDAKPEVSIGRLRARIFNAHGPQQSLKVRENSIEVTIDVRRRRCTRNPRDLGYRQLILEPKLQYQPVADVQHGDGVGERRSELPNANEPLGIIGVPGKLIRENLFADEIHEPSPSCLVIASIGAVSLKSSVLVTMVVEAQALCYEHKPGRELAASVCHIAPNSLTVVPPELSDHELIPVHDLIAATAETPRGGDYERAVALEESSPRAIPRRIIDLLE
jgi:hypothetical protein